MRASYNATGMGVESRDLDRVGDLWGRVAEARADAAVKGWADPPIVIENVLEPRLTPGRRGHWLVGVADEVPIPRGGRWASLGLRLGGDRGLRRGPGPFPVAPGPGRVPQGPRRGEEGRGRRRCL